MQDSIERSIVIAAPIERVWELVTEPGWWVPSDTPVQGDRTPGGVTVRESEKWGRFPVELVELRPMTYAAFHWASTFPGAELAPGRTTLVEFAVTDTGQGVRVAVTESGFSALEAADDVKADGIASNSDGWTGQLSHLRDEAQA
ncbi:SRPBCC domain-containing protein [Streptomyces sp. NBC_01198]|uniref:SRPBCC domain-containing protein n=1 Tax=Streptomyces sp. NBC_01198 TaxID=2903769 RepID=UPI002E13AD7A|nr:SRPBCC domain-containing protein [Streptomyces sp. NBC_01198]